MKKLIIFALLAGLTACTNNPNPSVVNRQAAVVSSGDGNYGIVPYGQSPVKSFVFKNNGTSSVSGSPSLIGAGFNLALQLGCETIEPGKNCLVKIMFNSTNKESGNYSSTLTVGDATVNLSASIASVPMPNYVFSVNGESVDTGELSLGELSGRNLKLLTVKIKNNSPKTGQVSSLTLSNLRYRTLQTNCNAVVLKPNQSCIAKVVVQGDNTNSSLATQISFDGQSGQISTQQVVQNLNGQMIAVNSSITLGDFYEEGTNKIQLLKIENQGDGAGNIDTSSITLPPGYSVGNNGCSNIKPGNTCIIRLVYSSSNLDKGSYTDTVSIGESDVDLTVNQVSNPNDLQSLNLTVAENIPVGACAPVSISLKDSENLDYVSSQAMAITATSTLYSDSSCATVDSLVIAPFESAKNLFIKKQTAGAIGLGIYVKTKYEEASLYFYSPLTLTSNKSNLVVGQQAQITVGGGRGPFSVETLSGGGTLTIGGLYTSDTVGVANFRVTDTVLNLQASVSINVASVLTVNTLSFEKVIDQYHTVVGSGGLSPYTYTVVSGPGVIDSYTGVYNSNSSGSVVLKLKDALNQEVLVNGQIYSPLIVNPLSKVIVSTGSHQIIPSGGKIPYTYTKLSGAGSVDTVSGIYSSATATTAQIKVSDALGQEQIVSIQVVLPLTASSSNFEKVVNQTLSIQGQNGLAPYVYTKVSGVGSVDLATGLYSAGASAGMVQLKITDAVNQEVLVNGQVYSQLNVTPLSKIMVSTSTHQIVPTGGKSPYAFTKLSGTGSVDSLTGIFSSPTETTAQIKVSDALGQEQTVSIQVVLPLTASISSFEKIVNQTQSVLGQNGLPPYVYTKVSGIGSIDPSTGLYTAGVGAGTVQLKITDALSQEVLVNGQIYTQLSLSPLNATIVLAQNQTFNASGGKLPYVFSRTSGVGDINSASGIFSSLTVGTAQIKVVDALNQEVTTGITVNSNLVLSAGTCSYATTPEQVDCTVSATGGVGTKTFSSSSGVINSASGVFYGVCANNLGESIVTVTDSQGNNQSITLSYPCVYKSCNQIKADISGVISGTFWVDTDANRTGSAPFKVYCDMEENGGGWTLVAKYGNTSNNTYHWFTTSAGTLSLDGTFTSTDIQIAPYANSQVSAAQKIMVAFNGVKNNTYVVDNLTVNKNRLWSGNPINEALGTLSAAHSSLTGSAYTLGNTVRMHFGTYGGNLGSGFTSGVSANQTLEVIADCPTYCTSRLPGVGAIPSVTNNWPLERSPIQAFVQTPYNKYPTGCADALSKGAGTGFITIDPDGFNKGLAEYQVYCDMTARTESTVVASGGSTFDYTVNGISYRSHTFPTGTTNLAISQVAASATIDALIVAGGGGGGSSGSIYAGGGGAGGMIVTAVTPSVTNYSMIVGAGGPAQNNGFASSAFGQTAVGGGAGGSAYGASGSAGGSGGGGAVNNGAPGNGTLNQGFAGGWSSGNGTDGNNGGGGGGGAGGRGADITGGQARNNAGGGGEGLQNSFKTGSPLWYAAGGCGSGYYYCSPVDGIGGATNGYIPVPPYTNVSSQPLTAGVAGTGSGGGGGRSSAGAAGGSGTIIIRYKFKTF